MNYLSSTLLILHLTFLESTHCQTKSQDNHTFKKTSKGVCSSATCLIDAKRMLDWMDHEVDLCESFYNFTCGAFLKYKPLNERYFSEGVGRIAEDKTLRRISEFLMKTIDEDEEPLIRFTKKVFTKCMDRDIIEQKNKFEYLQNIDKFGWGFPLIDEKWNGSGFSKLDILLKYPDLWEKFFGPVEIVTGDKNDDYDIFIKSFTIPQTPSLYPGIVTNEPCQFLQAIFPPKNRECLDQSQFSIMTNEAFKRKYCFHPLVYEDESEKEEDKEDGYTEQYESEDINGEDTTTEAIETPLETNEGDNETETATEDEKRFLKFFTFDQFQNMFANDSIDWENFFEQKLGIKITKQSVIKIANGNPEYFSDLHDFIEKMKWFDLLDDAAFLNWFYAKAFYEYREIFQFYSTVDTWQSYFNNRHRNSQRHEQCIEMLEKRFPYVMPVLTEKMLSKSSKHLINETISRVVEQFEISINQLDLSDSEKKTEIKNVKDYVNPNIFTALPPKLRAGTELTKFLDSIVKTDSLVQILLQNEVNVHPLDYNTKRFTDALKFVSYPFLASDRPKFLNDANFAVSVTQLIKSQSEVLNSKIIAYDQVYKFYSKWDDDLQTDRSLPGLQFNNKQMFWISLVHSRCFKKKTKAHIHDVSAAEATYKGSRALMKQAFGCDSYPGFQTELVDSEPNYEFVSSEVFEKLGLLVDSDKK